MAYISKPQLCVFFFLILTGPVCLRAEDAAASPPLDSSISKCFQDKVTLGLCVHRELLNYITTKKLDFSVCCQIVDGITADCYPFVTTDPIFGLIYNQFCAPTPPQQH